ncbi:hypothetical protein U732_3419 [Clostridium argentinense CDC 2741]|uniref:2'-5' RNA ligase superfamily protein n=1 Tax=Clostridium argentinense CDC 2741 TaxID=1418104 RepID=A0A0C1U0Y1_9CLOT|nr:hypothetical protein [Clostridium argentinense]ARC86394.1 hypothetical protein RSJ17_18830 [Clostridium argentinense]KIE46534.1 hypothetical protein U732_3419 [Clostridium argentinense CDC 2741]NFF37853.1 hypothetical protein [Clostridium argentinense]NFP49915.1 hypothetical protein [Clostridium argentinense]NFP71245.1 hypothetical protein [Clostridium argentinense]
MSFYEFLEKQENIYAEFRNTSKVKEEGLVPQISINRGGYIIALKHSKNIVDAVDNFTKKIDLVTSSIRYDESNIHTTLGTYEVKDEFSPANKTLELIINAVKNSFSSIKGIQIKYNEWLINQDSGIIAGIPNMNFYGYIEKLSEYTQMNGIEVKRPWGAHATVSRFLEKISYDRTLELLNIFKESKPIGISIPKYVDVGYFNLTAESFKINICERFKI